MFSPSITLSQRLFFAIIALFLTSPVTLFSQVKIYQATMEADRRDLEDSLFYNLEECRSPLTGIRDYPAKNNGAFANGKFLARVNSRDKFGPAIVLKVAAGDKIDLAVQSFYQTGNRSVQKKYNVYPDLAGLFVACLIKGPGLGKSVRPLLPDNQSLLPEIKEFTERNDPGTSGKPDSYLNWILLDDQFNFINSFPQSGAIKVKDADKLETLAYKGITIPRPGFLFVYLSNTTPGWDVYFDNLTISQQPVVAAAPKLAALSLNVIITEDGFNITTEGGQNLITEN